MIMKFRMEARIALLVNNITICAIRQGNCDLQQWRSYTEMRRYLFLFNQIETQND